MRGESETRCVERVKTGYVCVCNCGQTWDKAPFAYTFVQELELN